jgi:Rad52/22 family double-strand break repair protein
MQKVNGVEVYEPAVVAAAPVTRDASEPFQLPPEFLQKLKAPLPPEAVSPNSDKPGLSSIKVIFVVERLNEVFGLNGWKVVNEVVESGQMVVVKATLTVPKYGITVEQFGGNNNFDRGDAYKGACTDALSKCASYLGVGMDVYKGLHGDGRRSGSANVTPVPAEETRAQRGTAPSAANNANRTNSADPTGLTSKNMTERFFAMKGVLGNQEFNEVLGRYGVRDAAQISSLEKAREIYRGCLDAFRAHYVTAMRQLGRAEYGKILSELRFSPKARLSPEQSIRVFQFMQETLNAKQ